MSKLRCGDGQLAIWAYDRDKCSLGGCQNLVGEFAYAIARVFSVGGDHPEPLPTRNCGCSVDEWEIVFGVAEGGK